MIILFLHLNATVSMSSQYKLLYFIISLLRDMKTYLFIKKNDIIYSINNDVKIQNKL